MEQSKPLGGFKSGFDWRKIKRSKCKWPEFLICNHDCQEVIQLISRVSGEVKFELCKIEAERMGQTLIEAANSMKTSSFE